MPTLRLVRTEEPELDDEALVGLAARDRRAAADAVVRKWREPIFHHAAWIVKDWEEAIDVTQEVFIKAMREPRFFDPEFKRKAWLYRVTSNLCFNLVRDRRRRSVILETQVAPRLESEEAPPDSVVHGERQERILTAMDDLSEAHREILMLRYYSDQSYAEIADTLGIKLGTVMSRLSRAKEALLECLRAAGVDVSDTGGH
jgi:RNA polymerase sigma-70 factor (ECF subfamily)